MILAVLLELIMAQDELMPRSYTLIVPLVEKTHSYTNSPLPEVKTSSIPSTHDPPTTNSVDAKVRGR